LRETREVAWQFSFRRWFDDTRNSARKQGDCEQILVFYWYFIRGNIPSASKKLLTRNFECARIKKNEKPMSKSSSPWKNVQRVADGGKVMIRNGMNGLVRAT
jgi:hypothetical protein